MTRTLFLIAVAILVCLLVGAIMVTIFPYPIDLILTFACGGVIGITLSYFIAKDL